MTNLSPIAASTGAANTGSAAEIGRSAQAKFDTNLSIETGDGAQFRAALERHMNASGGATKQSGSGKDEGSLGNKIMVRASDLASAVKNDQQYVSKMLEKATATGDSMQLMKAMMALNDYQMRVQFISKTASKATSSLDQLTKLQ
jgi:hypothetical protein